MDKKFSAKQLCILNATLEAVTEYDYHKLSIEHIAARAGVGKSTIYRWWKKKADLIFDAFTIKTATIFELDLTQSLAFNLKQQLARLTLVLSHGIGRAILAAIVEDKEAAGKFFQQYLLPRRQQTYQLIQLAIQRQEIIATYPFDFMLDTIYAPIHYQIIFFNQIPDQVYIDNLVEFALQPILIPSIH